MQSLVSKFHRGLQRKLDIWTNPKGVGMSKHVLFEPQLTVSQKYKTKKARPKLAMLYHPPCFSLIKLFQNSASHFKTQNNLM